MDYTQCAKMNWHNLVEHHHIQIMIQQDIIKQLQHKQHNNQQLNLKKISWMTIMNIICLTKNLEIIKWWWEMLKLRVDENIIFFNLDLQ